MPSVKSSGSSESTAVRAKSDAELARLLRSSHQLKRRRKLRRAKKQVDWWLDQEIKLLGTMPDEDLARRLGRPVKTVRSKRQRLHIPIFASKSQPWMPA